MEPTYKLFQAALKARASKRAAEETAKEPAFRAGNSGAQVDDKAYVGSCKRRSLLRFLNVEVSDADDARQLMFEAGVANEDTWVSVLKDAGIEDERILCEEQIPIKWKLSTGDLVTGRPDVVVGTMIDTVIDEETAESMNGNGIPQIFPGSTYPLWTPEKVYELKLASSLWTGKTVLLEGKPKDTHVVQAAHYAWQLGTPHAELLYLSRADYAIGPSYTGMFMKHIKPEHEPYVVYREDGALLKLSPFLVSYELDWHTDGRLLYRQVLMDGTAGDYVKTVISKDGIRAYYEDIAASYKIGKLPARPTGTTVTGTRADYKECKYCPLASVCDKSEKRGLEPWLADVRAWAAQSAQVAELQKTHAIKVKK